MDFPNNIFVFLILVLGVTLNSAENSSDKRCDEIEVKEFMKLIDLDWSYNVTNSSYLIIENTQKGMTKNFKEYLQSLNSVFLQPKDYEDDILKTYNTTLEIKAFNFISIHIYVDELDRILPSLEYFVNIFGDASTVLKSTKLMIKLMAQDILNEAIHKLQDIRDTSQRKEIVDLVTLILEEPLDKIICIMEHSLLTDPEMETDGFKYGEAQYDSIKDVKDLKFRFSEDSQDLIKCILSEINKLSLRKMKRVATFLKTEEGTERIDGLVPYLRDLSEEMSSSKNVYDFIAKTTELNGKIKMHEPLKNWPLSFMNIELINFLFITASDDNTFSSAVKQWSLPLKHLALTHNPNELYVGYHKMCRNLESGGEKLEIRGYIVRLSEAAAHSCLNLRLIKIFAVKKIVIDVDLDLTGKEVQVVMVAPIWQVLGNRTIILSGRDGKDPEKIKAISGKRNGLHGLAGLPGGPAGSFYGIADNITNAENLQILADGGRGGQGQEGGDGIEGEEGKTFKIGPLEGWSHEDKYNLPTPNVHVYIVYGRKGQTGGRGGNGGVGGVGGNAGNVVLYQLRNNDISQSVFKSTENGKEGSDGKGGNGGRGGKNGNIVEFHEGSISAWQSSLYLKSNDTGIASPGLKGKEGISRKIRIWSKTLPMIQNVPSVVNEYKFYARTYLADSNFDEKDVFFKFYESLNNNEDIGNTYDVLSLVDEFSGLELQLFEMKKKMNLTSSYRSLERRIEKYKDNLNNKTDKNHEHQKVITVISKDIDDKLGKLNPFEDKHTLVVNNIYNENSLKIIPIKKLEELESVTRMTEWLDEHMKPLNVLIEEVQYMINEVIPNAMSDLESNLDQDMDALLAEILKLQSATDNESTELAFQREEFKRTVVLKAVFNVFQGIYTAVGAVSQKALGVATVGAATVTSFVENAVVPGDIKVSNVPVPKYVQELVTTANKQKQSAREENVFEHLKSKIEEEKKDASDEEVREMDLVWEVSQKVRFSSQVSIKGKLRDLEEACAKKAEELLNIIFQKTTRESIKKYEKAVGVAQYCKHYTEKVNLVGESYITIAAKLTEIDIAYNASRDDLDKLQMIENHISDIATPMLTKMMESINDFSNMARRPNKINRFLANWNTQETLKNVTHLLKDMTDGFEVGDDIKRTFSSISDALKVMMDLTDRIEEYRFDRSNKEFIAGLQMIAKNNLFVSDTKLMGSFARLKTFLMYNIVADAFDEWLFHFKQLNFPNAGIVIDKFQLPSEHMNTDISNVIADIKRNVDNLIQDYKNFDRTIVTLQDKKIQESFLGSKSNTKKAFYVWKNELYNGTIREILAGKGMYLQADVNYWRNSSAIKFKGLRILFTSKNPDFQDELDDILKDFELKLIHMGDSNYKCKAEVFQIHNEPLMFNIDYFVDKEGFSDTISESYSRIENGEFMLSPYATWFIQLSTYNSESFKSLEKFYNNVDLELVGRGQYLDDSDLICRSDLAKLYTKVNV